MQKKIIKMAPFLGKKDVHLSLSLSRDSSRAAMKEKEERKERGKKGTIYWHSVAKRDTREKA